MSDRGDPTKAASRILRERAMAILRDTRAKIDPALLAVMKERLSPLAGGMKPPPQAAQPEPQQQAAPPLKEGVFKRDYKQPPAPEEKQNAPANSPALEDEADENGMVPVDRQKIAQIVLQYMKNRDDRQKH